MVQRKFIPGDKWLYYKIYTGPKTADRILSQILEPFASRLFQKGIIEQWFFIRYTDPNYHIRFRLNLKDKQFIGKAIHEFNQNISNLIKNGFVWKLLLDTYNREVERYGEATMELTEEMFFYDSVIVSQFIGTLEGESGEQLRWLFSIYGIDQLLDAFKYSLNEKHKLLNGLKNGFGHEFGMNKQLKFQLDKKFRNHRPLINQLMKGNDQYAAIYSLMKTKNKNIAPVTEKILDLQKNDQLERNLNNFMGSYIHMFCNRLFKSKQRVHELVIYDYMERYYQSEIAKVKYMKKKTS